MWPTSYPTTTGSWPGCTVSGNSNVFVGTGQLMRALACAYLNAGYFSDYPITMQQVRDMWNAVKNGGLYCPSSMTCAPGVGMSASQIISYIEGMYDINADVVNLCKTI